MDIRIKRAYEAAAEDDGIRILIDRLWPRGVSKQKLATTAWLKGIAPSTELRHWFDHQPARWPEFRRRYHAELDANPEPLALLRTQIERGRVTLVYAAREEQYNDAVALREYLLGQHAK